MEENEFKEKMQEKSKILGFDFSVEQISKFYKYMNMLIKWNEKINLTAIIEPNEIVLKHFIDSLTIYKDIPNKSSVVDVGTGAGFPGIPLAIMNESLKITLVDSLNKRLIFLQEVINELNLKDNVILYGYKDKEFIREKLNDMSLYLMTSYEESFGLVLLEAAAFGIPAIAFSSAEGATEIIKDDVSGYIVNNRNKEEMKEKALELLNDKQKLALFGHEARLNAEDYSYDSVKEKWLSMINDILS